MASITTISTLLNDLPYHIWYAVIKPFHVRHSAGWHACLSGCPNETSFNGHILLECPALGDLRSQYAPLIAESSGIMAQLVWAGDQPLVSKYIIACLDRSEVH